MSLWSLHNDVKENIEKDYNVISYINLYDYQLDSNFKQLAEDLLSLRKEEFKNNELLVLTHFDTDYYIDRDIGILLYNLIDILRKIDFPTFFIAIYTNHYYLEKQIDYICNNVFFIENNFKIFYTPCQKLLWDKNQIRPINLNIQKIEFRFSSLCCTHRHHRKTLNGFLKEKIGLEDNLFSFTSPKKQSKNNKLFEKNKTSFGDELDNFDYIKNSNSRRVSEKYVLSKKNQNYYDNFFEYKSKFINTEPNSYETRYQYEILQKSFLDIVAESVFDYPCAYITEKTFRPITNKRPFIILGAPQTLNLLRDLGFKTFDKWINESYDKISCPNKRLDSIFDEILKLNSYPIETLKNILEEMESIIEHNFTNYFTLDKKIILKTF